jgi:sterol carrier protein 2
VGMIPFAKAGNSEDWDVMAEKAVRLALQDAGISYDQVEQAYAGYVYGDSTAGQSALYRVGISGIPIVNVNNNCATGATALYLARQMIALGGAQCVLVVGFEQMVPGALGMVFNDRKRTLDLAFDRQAQLQPADDSAPFAAQMFGGAGLEHQARHGTTNEAFAMISVKARRHAANNPMALLRAPVTMEEVLAAKPLYGPVTRLQACPPTCGAAAALLVSPDFAARNGIPAAVEIVAQALVSDVPGTFDSRSMMSVVGYDMTRQAATQVYESAGIGPDDLDVIELHDCFTANELISYEALGLTPEGTAERYIRDGQNSYGGKHVVNPSGGLLAKGHELTQQLRGTAGARQVQRARFGLQHNVGLGGACVVTLFGKSA